MEPEIPDPVYMVRCDGGFISKGHVCAASVPSEPGDSPLLCGAVATRRIGDIHVCQKHYDAAAAWREQFPVGAQLEDVAARRALELEHVRLEAGHRARVEKRRREISVIYYVRRGDGLIKIGTTSRLRHRLSTLRREHGDLQLLLIHSGGRDREGELHRKFAELRVTGEWFTARKRLTDWIRRCRLDPLQPEQPRWTVSLDVIQQVCRDGNRASLAAGRERRLRMEADTKRAYALAAEHSRQRRLLAESTLAG